MDCDVVVVGAGLTGTSAARTLAQRGYDVVLVESYELNHDQGSSHGTSRIYRRAYADPFYVGLTGRAEKAWQKLEYESGTQLRKQRGGIDAGHRRDPEGLASILDAAGVDNELLSAAAATERWPGMEFDGPVLYHAEAGYLDSNATVRAMAEQAVAAGAVMRTGEPVSAIQLTDTGVEVYTATGSYSARQIVLAVGAWLPELLANLALPVRLPEIVIKQQEVFHFRHHDPAVIWPSFVYKGDVQLYGLVSGADGGPEPAMKVAQFDSDTITTASGRDGSIDGRARDVVTDYVNKRLPGLEPEPVAAQSCLFTMTADEDFVIDRIGKVTIASPCSGHGAKFAPLLGELISDLVMGQPALPRFAFRN